MSRRPDLFMVGAPKSGTTSLYEYLRPHPDVFMSSVKEPMYFSPDLRTPRDRFEFGRDEERYLALFTDARDEKRVGEASTHYMSSLRAPSLIRDFQPDARITCILRNPVEVAYAWHGERVFRRVEKSRKFDLRLLNEEHGWPYLQVGRYGSQLTRWFDHFGRDRVHVIVFDEFVGDTPAEFRRLLEFLEVDPDFQPASFLVHNAVTTKSRLVPLLRTRPGRMAATAVRRVAGQRIAGTFSHALRSIPILNRRKPRPPMCAEVGVRLEDAYRDEIDLAGRLIGRDLLALWWRRPVEAATSDSGAA